MYTIHMHICNKMYVGQTNDDLKIKTINTLYIKYIWFTEKKMFNSNMAFFNMADIN